MYFHGCATVEEVKSLYRTLAKQHHPDRGGSTAVMQDINAEYHSTLARMDGQTHTDNDREYTYRYNQAAEQAAMDKVAELLRIRGDFDLYLIGTWVWVIGDTKPIKEDLKQAGCQWHSKRSCWYWRAQESRHHGRMSRYGLAGLAMRYGYQEFSVTEAGEFALA